MDNKKKRISILFFLLVLGLTLYTFLHNQNMGMVLTAIINMKPIYFMLALFLGLIFVSLEGLMLWHIMHSMGEKGSLLRYIGYSFIGFFYSGITPSATGGQPMQLFYMKKDGHKTSRSTVSLMTVAVLYKFVLVLIGILILVIWSQGLSDYLGNYFYLYLVGLFLNSLLVVFILLLMFCPSIIRNMGQGVIEFLFRFKLIKEKNVLQRKWNDFVKGYSLAVDYIRTQKILILRLLILTVIQRCSVFFVTYLVYYGFGQVGKSGLVIMALQASVYIAVDMIPVPGSQGITELMYQAVFANVFQTGLLLPSMLVSRSVNFYVPLVVSLGVVLMNKLVSRRNSLLRMQ